MNAEAQQLAPGPANVADVLAAARALVPQIAARAPQANHWRRLHDETLAALHDSGIMSILRPRRFGGLQLPWGTHAEVAAVLAEGCGSTAWMASVVGAHAWVVGRMGEEFQQEVFDRRDAIVSTAFANGRNARVETVDGGFRISGRWALASGIENAGWLLAAAHASGNKWGRYEMTLFGVPRSDVRVLDTWDAEGLMATGSHDVVLENVFVPVHRTAPFNSVSEDGPAGEVPWLYRLDILPYYYTTLLGPIVGSARGAFLEYARITRTRLGQMHGDEVRRQTPVQLRVAECGAAIHSARLLMQEVFAICGAGEREQRVLTREEKVRVRLDMGYAARLCRQAVTTLQDMMGAAGLARTNSVNRFVRDTRAAAAHSAIAWDAAAHPFGAAVLGLDTGQDAIDGAPRGDLDLSW